MRRLIVAGSALFALACGAARAPVATFEALPSRLEVGKTVVVEDVAGQQHQGRLVRIARDLIAFEANGVERSLAGPDVRRISACCDSLANGAAIGLGAGVLGGLATGGQWIEFGTSVSEGIGALLLFGGLGAAAGAGIDASNHKNELVYLAPGLTARLSGGPKRPLLSVTVTW